MPAKKLLELARIDSEGLAKAIRNRGSKSIRLLIALVLGCNTYSSIKWEDLLFILSNSKSNPSLSYEKKKCICYDLNDKTEEKFPEYEKYEKLDSDIKEEFKYIKEHGYVVIDNFRKIKFTHPIYYYAGKILLKEMLSDVLEEEEIIPILERSLGCLSVSSNICCINRIEDIYIETDNEKLKQIILKGLYSIFPPVRDRVIIFLDRNVNKLNNDEKRSFIEIIKAHDTIENGGIIWNKGVAWFNPETRRCFFWERYYDTNDIEEILDMIQEEIEISSENMWILLNTHKDIITLKILEKALEYDESFIREKAIRLMFERYAFNLEEKSFKKYLDLEEHSNFIYGLFRGTLQSISKYSVKYIRLVVNYTKEALKFTSMCIKIKGFIENFEDEFATDGIEWTSKKNQEESMLWAIWHEIYIEFLNKFPSEFISMNQVHMIASLDKSLEYVTSSEQIIKLTTIWFKWLNEYNKYKLPDDYGMSVARYLMKGTKEKYINRRNIFEKLVKVSNTNFATTNIRIFVEYWENLCCEEKNMLIKEILSNRQDQKWLQAATLSCNNVPKEIQIAIFKKTINMDEIREFKDALILNELLEQCLNIYCGYPQPLWWNGYHHCNTKLWDIVIIEVIKSRDINMSFKIALRELIDCIYNDNTYRFGDLYGIYREILINSTEKRKLVFERLFYETVNQNQCNKKAWDLLFEYSTEEEKKYYYDKIAENIELVENYQIDHGDILALFDNNVVNELYNRLESDRKAVLIVDNFKKSMKEIETNVQLLSNLKEITKALKRGAIENLINIYKNDVPRLQLTSIIIKSFLKELDINSIELEEALNKNRDKFYYVIKTESNKYYDYYELENWIK